MRSQTAAAQVIDSSEKPTVREVFLREGAFVLRAVRRMGVPDAEVEDVAQEVFLVLHRRMAEYDGVHSMRSWLFGIARRVVADYRRLARVRRERASPAVLTVSTPPEQAAAVERKHARRILDEALESLTDDQREVFVLYELEGMSMREVAELVGCPLQTGYSRLHAARAVVMGFIEKRARRT